MILEAAMLHVRPDGAEAFGMFLLDLGSNSGAPPRTWSPQ